jgi:hypothetical protein
MNIASSRSPLESVTIAQNVLRSNDIKERDHKEISDKSRSLWLVWGEELLFLWTLYRTLGLTMRQFLFAGSRRRSRNGRLGLQSTFRAPISCGLLAAVPPFHLKTHLSRDENQFNLNPEPRYRFYCLPYTIWYIILKLWMS